MRTCIHSSAYNPAVHIIVGGPYSSASQCESSCSSPTTTTTLTPTTTTQNPNSPLLPPIVSFMQGSYVFNINAVPVTVFPQYVLDTTTITLAWTDLPIVNVQPKSFVNLNAFTSSVVSQSSTPILRAKCTSSYGSQITRISNWSLTSYGGSTTQPTFPSYENDDNILAPIFNGRKIYNLNNFSVIALVQYAYNSTPTSSQAALALERNWSDFRLSPIVIAANSVSNDIIALDNNNNISTRYLRARFVKNDSISTSVSSYGNNYG